MKYGICVSMYRKDSKYRKPGENVVKIREIRVSRRLENKSKYGSGKDEGGGGRGTFIQKFALVAHAQRCSYQLLVISVLHHFFFSRKIT